MRDYLKKENAPVCDVSEVHPGTVDAVREKLPDEDFLIDLAELFRLFGDSTRIKILYALYENELCVCDLAEALNMSQSAVSHQLRVLKDSKLVKYRRNGKQICYSLDDEHVSRILALGKEHLEEE